MKKAFGIIAVIALFFAVLPFVRAESTAPSPKAATSTEPTKWEVLGLMQKGGLLADKVYEESFSENEINEFIAHQLDIYGKKWFIDNAAVTLNDGNMDIMLHVLRPFPGNLEINSSIEIEEGVAKPVINSAWYGYFPAPASFVERIGNFIMKKKSASEWFDIGNAHWESVTIKENSLSFAVRGAGEQ